MIRYHNAFLQLYTLHTFVHGEDETLCSHLPLTFCVTDIVVMVADNSCLIAVAADSCSNALTMYSFDLLGKRIC